LSFHVANARSMDVGLNFRLFASIVVTRLPCGRDPAASEQLPRPWKVLTCRQFYLVLRLMTLQTEAMTDAQRFHALQMSTPRPSLEDSAKAAAEAFAQARQLGMGGPEPPPVAPSTHPSLQPAAAVPPNLSGTAASAETLPAPAEAGTNQCGAASDAPPAAGGGSTPAAPCTNPATVAESAPATSAESAPATSADSAPATRAESAPATSAESAPAAAPSPDAVVEGASQEPAPSPADTLAATADSSAAAANTDANTDAPVSAHSSLPAAILDPSSQAPAAVDSVSPADPSKEESAVGPPAGAEQEEGDEAGECPICFEPIVNGLSLPCLHGPFCQPCIIAWSGQNRTCPVCRRTVGADSGDCWVHMDAPSPTDMVDSLFMYIAKM